MPTPERLPPATDRLLPATERLTAAAARRIALAAQGFTDPRPSGRVDARHIRRVFDRVGLLQIDSVNVLSRSHYLPVFARLGAYPRDLLDRLTGFTAGPLQRETFEYWAHEASILPLGLHPYLRWRMERAADESWGGMQRLARDRAHLLDHVRELLDDGPLRASQTGLAPAERRPGEMWNWAEGKVALEYLFWSGEVTAARRVNFERVYDRTERVLPAAVVNAPTPSREDAHRELLRVSARALGVATEPDLGDYFRLPRAESKARVAELVEAGELLPVEVVGWKAPAYLWPEARRPRRVNARALLSPFDSLIWFRPRAARIFGMEYRIEIYTPAPKRIHGYYVLPFLLGEHLVARVDLKADRQASVLRVQGAHAEPVARGGPDAGVVVVELAAALREMADWLELDDVEVVGRGDLAPALATVVR